MSNTYAERLAPHQNFKDKHEMDEHVTKYLRKIGYMLTDAERKILYYIKSYAVRYPGAFQQLRETIAEATGYSLTTVKRALTKFVELGILVRKNTRKKNNSRVGATIYQIQRFPAANEPQKKNRSNSEVEHSNTCVSKTEADNAEKKPFISSRESLKDSSYPKDGTVTSEPKIDQVEKKISLRQKIAQQLKKRSWSVKAVSEFAKIAYGQIKKLLQQDATIPKSYAEELVYKKFLVAIDHARNPFALFSYLVNKEFTKLLGQSKDEQCELELEAKRGVIFDLVPQFMIDDEQDPLKKARLIKQNEIAMRQREEARQVEQVPEWMEKERQQQQNAIEHTEAPVTNSGLQSEITAQDGLSEKEYFALQQAQFLARLASL